MFNRLKSLVSTPTSSVPSTPGDQTPPALPSGGQTSPQLPGTFRAPLPKPEHLAALREAVPCAECDSCEDNEAELTAPDEEHYPSFPKKFDMDQESEMLGTCKPMHRLVLTSTDKSDWPHNVASDPQSLAFHLGSVHQKQLPTPPSKPLAQAVEGLRVKEEIPGVYDSAETAKLTVLASSVEMEQDEGETSVLVFPDFKVVQPIPISKAGAQDLYDKALSPTVGRIGGGPAVGPTLKSWILPYEAVVLLCSHKTRDKRCHIAAPLLSDVITSTLALHDYTVDHKGSALHDLPASEQLEALEGGEEVVEGLLRKAAGSGADGLSSKREGSKEVGVFNISHLGGHRYSGVMIICFPSGSILYYGRVTPKACVAIVEQTILKGKVLPEHLRGGANLTRPSGKTLLDW